MKLSKAKSKIKTKSVKYLGYNLCNEGLSVYMNKIKAISDNKTPSKNMELRRFLGITYLGKTIANLSNETGCLGKLLSKNVQFVCLVMNRKRTKI